MRKVLNKCTHMPLTHIGQKLDQHIEKMNVDNWELMSVAVEAVGIEELFILFWRKELPDMILSVKVDDGGSTNPRT